VGIRFLRTFEGDPSQVERAASLLSRAVAAGGLALIAATWPLWTPQTVFPQIPLFGTFRRVPAWLDWPALVVACVSLMTALIAGSRWRIGRWSLLAFAGAVTFLVLADQHRLQPWAYELSLLALILAVLPASEAVAWSRLLVVSIYFYSALSKFDWTFIESGGGQIVEGLSQCLQMNLGRSALPERILAGALACGELLVAAGLCWKRTRRVALIASLAMHALLLAALGPWGARQKPAVLLWNVYFIVQNLVLFGMAGNKGEATAADVPLDSSIAISTRRPWQLVARGLILLAVFFPLSEPFGICDVWPAWAVYATGPENLRVYIDPTDIARVAAAVGPYVDVPRYVDGRCLVRIDRWALDATRAPLYPQNRFRLGIALAIAEAAGLQKRIHVEIEGPANHWTGQRSSHTLTGATAIAAELDRDWLNGFPRPFADEILRK
jgi:hypothetical protein